MPPAPPGPGDRQPGAVLMARPPSTAVEIGGGLLVTTTTGGAVLGAVAGHAAGGMSRHDLKELADRPVSPANTPA